MNKRKRIAVIGPYDENGCGQTIKTISIYETLSGMFTDCDVIKVNTSFWRKRICYCLSNLLSSLMSCNAFVVLLAHSGIVCFAKYILPLLKKCHKSVYYVVIGGWLPSYLLDHLGMIEKFQNFDVIFAETKSMKSALIEMGIKNVEYMPNYKKLDILDANLIQYEHSYPLRLCTFSRVMKEKGIEDAIYAVNIVNQKYERAKFKLDIYGVIEETQRQWFEELQKSFPREVQYCGVVQYNKSVEVLKNYYALLFPTHFFTEGIPGTIIDAYAAGLPVIASKWINFSDIIDEGITGIGYTFENNEELINLLEQLAENPMKIDELRKNCLLAFQNYTEENAIRIFQNKLGHVF